jgi:hypothetical protein
VAFDNPDHVDIMIHNYRWRLGVAEGEPKYDDLEKRLAEGWIITAATITLEGDASGAPHPDASSLEIAKLVPQIKLHSESERLTISLRTALQLSRRRQGSR